MYLSDSLAYLAGMIGIFIAAPLLHLWKQRLANAYLGIFIIAFSLLSFASSAYYATTTFLFGSLEWSLGVLGPSIYLYARSVCGDEHSIKWLWHFFPTIVLLSFLIGCRIDPQLRVFFGPCLLVFQAYTIAYAVASLVRLTAYKAELMDNFSSTKGRDLNWLIGLSLTLICLLILWIPATLTFGGGIWWWMLIFGRFAVLFIVGWWGIRQKMVFLPVSEEPHATYNSKYQHSGMNEETRANIKELLQRYMSEEKFYLQNDLRLASLAQILDTSPQLLSEYFNQSEGKTFFQYINELRVTEAKKLLINNRDTAILDVAYSSGFNSKSTFNTAFKNISGVSPSEWRKNQLK